MSGSDDPFAELDRLFDRLTEGLGAGGIADLAPVPVDVVETGDEVVVTADLPGYDAENIEVTVEDRTLTIRAERDEDGTVEGRYVRRERRRREASRRVALPTEVVESEATADYADGVLTVRLPATTEEGHRIEVE
ncbi:MAG: Hsp20/alpha crystallin family protein [Haloferacaceae archaeon]